VQVLRALAVVLVIFFHAKVPGFQGGFLGVDIFFVISGYWMSAILIKEIESGAFSFSNFYERRLRRILPALYVTLLLVLIVSWFELWPRDFDTMSRVMGTSVLFLANAVIRNQADDYFAPELDSHPLLHIWSLSLEEQFYLLFPLVLLLIYKSPHVMKRLFIWLIPIVSFYTAIHFYQINPTATFYHLPARVWEFWLGYVAACWVRSNKGMHHVTYWLAIVVLFSSVLLANETSMVPGWGSLAPAMSTAIILSSSTMTLSFQNIFWKAAVWVGGISYSLYLLHQPILSFLRLRGYDNWLVLMGITLLLGLAGSQLMKRFVEDPFRDKRKVTSKSFWAFAVFIGFGLIVISYFAHESNGFRNKIMEWRLGEEDIKKYKSILAAESYDMYEEMVQLECNFWVKNPANLTASKLDECADIYGKAVLVFGDSHAMNLYNIYALSNRHPFLIGISQGGCRPHDGEKVCHYEVLPDFIIKNDRLISYVIFHQSGSYFIKDSQGKLDSQKAFDGDFAGFDKLNIDRTINYLNKLILDTNSNVIWVGPFPEYRRDTSRFKRFEDLLTLNKTSVDIFSSLEAVIFAELIKKDFNAYVSFKDFYSVPNAVLVNGCFLYRDVDHYSRCGEQLIADRTDWDNNSVIVRTLFTR